MSESRIIFSSDGSHLKQCKVCFKDPCKCPKPIDVKPADHTLKMRREVAGRGGGVVTVIFDFPFNPTYFKELTSKLKSLCGAGGTFKEKTIEIQGDHRDKIKAHLEKMGFKVKLAGG